MESALLHLLDMRSHDFKPARQHPVIREHMTPAPHTIGRSRSLSAAHHMMRDHQVRHLPVLERGQIVGVVSQRDLLLIESLPGVNPTEVQVEDAMVEDVFTVSPETPLAVAVEGMIERKLGSAVVCEGDRVVGIFTTVDALQALHALLERP
jgi:acetoin utilization protein AcuB